MENITYYQDGTVDVNGELFAWRGGIGRAVLGRNTGKFSNASTSQLWQRMLSKEVLIDVSFDQLLSIALNVPHLNIAISKFAEMFANAYICHKDKDGEEVENSQYVTLLNNPNFLKKTLEAFLSEYAINNCIYRTNFCYKNYGRDAKFRGTDLPKFMWWLPPGRMRITRNKILPYRQSSIEGVIESFSLLDDPKTFTPDEILLLTEGISSNGLTGESPLVALQICLSNIVAALKSNNIILTERGLIGFISPDGGKDSFGTQSLSDEERKRMEQQYQNNYDLDNRTGHVTIATSPIRWQPMTFDMNQLQLDKGLEREFCTILGALGLHRNCFPSSTETSSGMTTGNEIDAGLRWTYQNTMQPLLDEFLNEFTRDFKMPEGEYLSGNYEWLPCMQADQLKEAQAKQTENARLSQLYKDGVITLEQYSILAEVEFEEVSNMPQNASQSNLRGLVGSVTGILQISQFVAQGFMNREAGVATIMQIYGFDEATANSMITNTKVDVSVAAPSTTIAAQ